MAGPGSSHGRRVGALVALLAGFARAGPAGRTTPGFGRGPLPGTGRGVAARGERAGDRLVDLVFQRSPRCLAGHQVGDHVADLGEPPHRLGVPGRQQVQAPLRAVVNGAGPDGGLIQHLLGLRLGGGERVLGVLGGLADGALGLQPGRVAHLVRLGPGSRYRVLRLFLRRRQHPLGLLARLGADPVGFLLGLFALLGDLILGTVALGLGLVVGELENLADPLADLLMGGLAAQALPRGGQFQPDPLGIVERVREPVLKVADLAAGTRDELVHLAAAVSAHLDFEGAFTVQVGHQVCVISHCGTQKDSRRSASPPVRARPGVGMWRQRARLSSLTTHIATETDDYPVLPRLL